MLHVWVVSMVQGSFPTERLDALTWFGGDSIDVGHTMPEGIKNWKMPRCIW